MRSPEAPQKGSPKALTAGGSRMMIVCLARDDDSYRGNPAALVICRSLRSCDERLRERRESQLYLYYSTVSGKCQ